MKKPESHEHQWLWVSKADRPWEAYPGIIMRGSVYVCTYCDERKMLWEDKVYQGAVERMEAEELKGQA